MTQNELQKAIIKALAAAPVAALLELENKLTDPSDRAKVARVRAALSGDKTK